MSVEFTVKQLQNVVGKSVGLGDGIKEGLALGEREGVFVGGGVSGVGYVVTGGLVGLGLGERLGIWVGEGLGIEDGLGDGSDVVGSSVGLGVGKVEGIEVGVGDGI